MARRKFACFLVILPYLTCYIVASHSCGETQCQISIQGDSSSEFRLKASEEGVRLVYINFEISNNGKYNPLVSKNRILPYRWTWAQSIREPMLSLSYDYDVLSLGLLKNQARSMVVLLKELHTGCLVNLNSSCQDIAIAKALTGITRNLTSSKLPNEREGVVCFRIIQEFSFGIGGGFKYTCCAAGEQSNDDTINCGLDVKESKWLAVFNAILAVVVGAVFLYWPLLLCAIPDSLFKEDHEGCETDDFEDQILESIVKTHGTVTRGEGTGNYGQSRHIRKSLETIPVDDLSPITFAMMIRQCSHKLPTLSHGFNVKLFFIWYCVIPIFFYIKIVLYFIIKSDHFDDASKKLLFQVGDFYLNVFSMDRPLVYVLFILPLFIIPGVLISCWRPEKENSARKITPQKEILRQLKAVPQIIPQKLLHLLKAFLSLCKGKLRNEEVHSQHSLFGHVICVLWTVTSMLIIAPVVALLTFLVILFASVLCIIIYSPYFCFMKVTFRYIHKRPVYRGILFLTLVYSSLSVYILAVFSCQFVVRMFGFIIMGLTLNAEVTIPYVTFVFVVWRNIHLCFKNVQDRYKEIKEMISEQWKELTGNEDTIPTDLFWFVCNKYKVLPVANELCRMLWNVIAILVFLVIALSAIFLFNVALYNSSAIVSTIAVFVSGKLSEVFFSQVTTGYSFSGWEKLRKKEMIRSAVTEFNNQTGTTMTSV